MLTKIGNNELVHSGLAILPNSEPLTVVLKDDVEGDYYITFTSVIDLNINSSITRFTRGENKFHLNIDLVNVALLKEGGNTELAKVGTLRHRELYLNYRFISVGAGKTLFYNFLLGEEVNNGN